MPLRCSAAAQFAICKILHCKFKVGSKNSHLRKTIHFAQAVSNDIKPSEHETLFVLKKVALYLKSHGRRFRAFLFCIAQHDLFIIISELFNPLVQILNGITQAFFDGMSPVSDGLFTIIHDEADFFQI